MKRLGNIVIGAGYFVQDVAEIVIDLGSRLKRRGVK